MRTLSLSHGDKFVFDVQDSTSPEGRAAKYWTNKCELFLYPTVISSFLTPKPLTARKARSQLSKSTHDACFFQSLRKDPYTITIRPILPTNISACVNLIRESFLTVANEFGITPENAPRFTAFAISKERLMWQYEHGRCMFGAFSNDCDTPIGYYALDIAEDGGTCELCNLCVSPSKTTTVSVRRCSAMQGTRQSLSAAHV